MTNIRFGKMKIKLVLLTLISFFMLISCKKKEYYTVYFYQRNSTEAGIYRLYIDGKNRGELPFVYSDPSTTDSTIKEDALTLRLKEGKYGFTVYNSSDDVVAAGTLKFSSKKISNSSTLGYSSIKFDENNTGVVELGE